MIRLVTYFLFFVFVISLKAHSQATNQMTVEKMRFNILKIEKAIDSTKEKIKNINDAQFLPDLYLSLAEFYVQKSKFKYALKIAENPNEDVSELDFTFEKRIKIDAIQTYDLLIDKFPKFEQRDKAIFFKAHEQRELGLVDEMILTYFQLTKEYPTSSFWAEAQIIVGDYYFEQQKKIDLALEVYKRILKKPLSAFTPLAHYKIGWCYINKSQFFLALQSFEKVLLDFKKIDESELPENLRKTDVRSDALKALVWPYSEVDFSKVKPGPLKRRFPLQYFKALSPSKRAYMDALKKLGRRLTVKNGFLNATRVYSELLRQATELEDRMDLIPRLYVSMKNTQKQWPVRGFVQEIVKTMPLIMYSEDLKAGEKKKAFYDYEIYARDVATRQDKRARQVKSKEELDWALRDYESYLSVFKYKKQFYNKLLGNLADVYFLADRFVDAGRYFEKIAKRSKDKNKKTEYLQSGLESYINALKDPENLSEIEIAEARYGLRSTGSRFVKLNKNHVAVPNIIFSIGQSYYDQRDFSKSTKYLKYFVKRFPRDKNVVTAVNLVLDSFNQIEDYKRIVKEGKSFLANRNIKNPALKSQLNQLVQQAEMKVIQKESGDTASASYASNLLKMASKYKGSSLGDKALYEAFLTFKAKGDAKAYSVGTELALKHKSSKYALQVITDMGQMALSSADFKQASLFFELFYERYPQKRERLDLMKSAAQMRELMGDYKIAAEDHVKLKNYTDAARMDYLGRYWTNLVRSSARARGVWRDYWQGIATFRLKGLRAARSHLRRAADARGNDPKEQEASAHALYLLANDKLQRYKKIKITLGNEAKAVNDKASGLQALESELKKVIQFGNGRWTIAALYGLGQSYTEFADFLRDSPIPKGLSATDRKAYKKAIGDQAKQYSQTALNYYRQCTSAAEKNLVFTEFVKGCLSRGKRQVDEASENVVYTRSASEPPAGSKRIRKQLLEDRTNTKLLDKLAQLYMRQRDYATAELIQKRILEIKENDASATAKVGVIKMFKQEYEQAHFWLQKSFDTNRRDPHAVYGLAGLYKNFYFKSKLSKLKGSLRAVRMPSSYTHPYMTKVK